MITQRERFAYSVQTVADLLVVVAAWLCAYPLRFGLLPLRIQHVPSFWSYAWLAILAALVWAVGMRLRTPLDPQPSSSLQRRLFIGLQRHLLSFVIFVVITFFVSAYKPSRIVLLIFLLLSTTGVAFVRIGVYRLQKARIAKGKGVTRVLIVGTGDLAQAIVKRLQARPDLGLQVSGMLTDDAGQVGQKIDELPVLGTVEQVQQLVDEHAINSVYVALPLDAHDRLKVVLANLEQEMVDVKVVPDLMEFVVLQSSIEDFAGLPVISLKQVPISGWGVVAKRVFDVLFAATVLVIGSPVFLLISLAIKLSSRGPVLYAQERMGLDGRTFDLYKFRSMRVDAEQSTGAVWAVQDDPRRTKIGALLRKTNLDELPQFFNVLRGEMSVVGPRPERPVFIEQFRGQIPKYMLRHKMKAGLTGWAQVNGWRGNTDLQKRIESDLYYIENWSFWLDLRIIWMTVFSKASREHAY